jgi:hypothetical protein
MGLKNEYSYDVFDGDDDDFYEYSDDDFTDFHKSTYEDWCDINSTNLLNGWFILQENAQLYYKLNQKLTYADWCEFMYCDSTCEDFFHAEDELSAMNLWYSIGSPKTFIDFYNFYR